MKEEKTKKDAYVKALSAYGEAMKEFHKGRLEKAEELLKAFLEKHDTEKELVDRAKIYLQITRAKGEKEAVSLKTFEDYIYYSVYKINSRAYEEALKLLEKALEMEEGEGRVFYLMADAYILMGKTEEAMECLKKAFQKDKVYRILAQNEIDFAPLWDDKKFKLITRLT
ncbi:MAG: tetratricopeptide repeat protein [Candidatus Aminicenantales bacterium]